MKDLVVLSDAASYAGCEGEKDIRGYRCIKEVYGIYDTRIKIYQSTSASVVVFRPTQSSVEGENIHKNRRLVSCTPLLGQGCLGQVNDRFQEAFLTLVKGIDIELLLSQQELVYLTGHSLGGALQLMMGVYLYYNHSIVPQKMIGFAGPFIGDKEFTQKYIDGLRSVMLEEGAWQVETFNNHKPEEYDGTAEDYQVDAPLYMEIDQTMVCGIGIDPLSLHDSYGMHDLKNYALFFESP
jgi:hypothetical protein